MPRTDAQLLKAFGWHGDERAFQELSQRYLGMIYNAALRRSAHPQIAEEAAQNVLSLLARKASDLSNEPSRLASWLHRAATWEAANLLRAEQRHRKRIQALMEQPTSDSRSRDGELEKALRHLDSSLLRLSEGDRQLVILHYLQGKTHREIAEVVGKSESAVQRQCHRCLQKLASLLVSRGVRISCGTCGAVLSAEAAKAVPVSLLTKLPASALLTPGVSSLPFAAKSILLMTINQKILLTVVVVVASTAIPIWMQRSKLKEQQVRIVELEESNRQLLTANSNASASGVIGIGVPEDASVRAQPPQMDRQSMKELASSNWNRRGEGTKGIRILASVVENMTPDNIEGVLEAIESAKASGRDTTGAERTVWTRIGEIDGKRWMNASIPEHPDDSPSSRARLCLTGWGSADPRSATEWFDQLEEGRFKNGLTASVLTGASWNDPALAFEFMTRLPSEVQIANRDTIAQNLTHNEGNSAADRWIASLESSGATEEAELAFDSLFRKMVNRNIENALSWVSGDVARTYFDDGKKSQLVSAWATKEPHRAADWVVSDGNPDLLAQVIESCPASKFNAMGEWLGSRNGESYYQDFANAFADRIESSDPEAAAIWRSSMVKANPLEAHRNEAQ